MYEVDGAKPKAVAAPCCDHQKMDPYKDVPSLKRDDFKDLHTIADLGDKKKFSNLMSTFYSKHSLGFMSLVLDIYERTSHFPRI